LKANSKSENNLRNRLFQKQDVIKSIFGIANLEVISRFGISF